MVSKKENCEAIQVCGANCFLVKLFASSKKVILVKLFPKKVILVKFFASSKKVVRCPKKRGHLIEKCQEIKAVDAL